MEVMVNRIIECMTLELANYIIHTENLRLSRYSFSDEDIGKIIVKFGNITVNMVKPDDREECISFMHKPYMVVDINRKPKYPIYPDIEFYCQHEMSVITDIKGDEKTAFERRIRDSCICALILPEIKEKTSPSNDTTEYASRTIDAIKYLSCRIAAGEKGKVYSLNDALKSA